MAPDQYTAAQWRRACLVDTGVGDVDAKTRYRVPVRDPSGVVNRSAVHAGVRGLVDVTGVSPEQRASAARRLIALYREIGDEPPETLMGLAGMAARAASPETGVHYRSFHPELQVRSSGDGRTIYGIAVPWDAPTRIDEQLVESFARGAFTHQYGKPSRIRAAREHVLLGGTLIGALSEMRDDPAGQYVELRVSKTPVGDETLELVRDGALDQLSVAFRERQNRRLPGGITQRVKADMMEVAVVMEGAYGELASAVGVRSAGQSAGGDAALRAQAEQYLLGLPEPVDHDLTLRSIRLGLPL